MLEWYLGILIHILSIDKPDKTFPKIFRDGSPMITFQDSLCICKGFLKSFFLSSLIIIINSTDDFCWHTNSDGIGRNIVSNDRAQTNNTIIAYYYVLQYPHITGKPHIVADCNMPIAW